MKVKVGDNVKILAGKDKGKEGKVLRTLKNKDKMLPFGPFLVIIKPKYKQPLNVRPSLFIALIVGKKILSIHSAATAVV